MLDVAGESLGSHLDGVASLLQSRRVHGDVCGIRGASYWTWYRHEVWAALQTGRRMSLDETYWEPEPRDSYEGLPVEDIANRVLFLFGQCINFCNDQNAYASGSVAARAAALDEALDAWKAKLPASMTCFPVPAQHTATGIDGGGELFPTWWFVFPQSGTSVTR